MAKKIQLSNRTRQRIKDNFAKIKPASLKKNELAYYNKIKAGKARAATAFKDSSGKYYPKQFVEKEIISVAKEIGISPRAVYNNFRDEIEDKFRTRKLNWSVNERGIYRIDKVIKDDLINVETFPGVYEKLTPLEIKELFAELKQHLQWKANREGTTIAAVHTRTERDYRDKSSRITLPRKENFEGKDLDEILDMIKDEFPDLTVVVSEKPRKKKK